MARVSWPGLNVYAWGITVCQSSNCVIGQGRKSSVYFYHNQFIMEYAYGWFHKYGGQLNLCYWMFWLSCSLFMHTSIQLLLEYFEREHTTEIICCGWVNFHCLKIYIFDQKSFGFLHFLGYQVGHKYKPYSWFNTIWYGSRHGFILLLKHRQWNNLLMHTSNEVTRLVCFLADEHSYEISRVTFGFSTCYTWNPPKISVKSQQC